MGPQRQTVPRTWTWRPGSTPPAHDDGQRPRTDGNRAGLESRQRRATLYAFKGVCLRHCGWLCGHARRPWPSAPRTCPRCLGDAPENQHSKDIWVYSDRPVNPFSLISSLKTVSEFTRGSDLPSRVADHLLWLGRYLERAEGLTRLLTVGLPPAFR